MLSHVRFCATPWSVARQASLSITNSQNLLKLTSIESVMPSNHRPPFLLLSIFPSIRAFSNVSALCTRWQSIEASDLPSVLPMNIQEQFPLGLSALIFLLSKGLSRVFSSTTVQKHQVFSAQPSVWSIHDYWKNHSFD